jgi:hypothetical protein
LHVPSLFEARKALKRSQLEGPLDTERPFDVIATNVGVFV